jgi:hypothetical protein
MGVRAGLSDPALTRAGGVWGYDPSTRGWYRQAVAHCRSVAAVGAAGRRRSGPGSPVGLPAAQRPAPGAAAAGLGTG